MKKIINGIEFDETIKKTKKQTVRILREIVSKSKQEEYEKEVEDEKRIQELRKIINDKKLLDMDCTAEQLELKQLLGL